MKVVVPGVGIADEPPQVEVLIAEASHRQSFGKFLSKLILAAWSKNKAKTDVGFLRLALIALRTAKMDPLKPHKHSLRAEVEAMAPGLNQALEDALK